MTKIQRWILYGSIASLVLAAIAGVLFNFFIVGIDDYYYDTLFAPSILFGWLLIFGGIAAVIANISGVIFRSRRLMVLGVAELCVMLLLFFGAYAIQRSGYYMPEGGPAGPMMSCYTWEELSSHDEASLLCATMYVPAYLQYIIVVPALDISYQTGWSLEDGVAYLVSLGVSYGLVALPLVIALVPPDKHRSYPQKSRKL